MKAIKAVSMTLSMMLINCAELKSGYVKVEYLSNRDQDMACRFTTEAYEEMKCVTLEEFLTEYDKTITKMQNAPLHIHDGGVIDL